MKGNVQLLDFPLLYDYYLNGKPVTVSTTHLDLDVVVSSDLKWKSHYEVVLSKVYKIMTSSPLPFVLAKKVLYISLVRSQLLYCSQNVAATSLDRHQSIRRSSEKSYKIYSK